MGVWRAQRTVSGGRGQNPECHKVETSVTLPARALHVGCAGFAGGGPECSEGVFMGVEWASGLRKDPCL